MFLEFNTTKKYDLNTETKIPTSQGALYKATDLYFNRTVAVKEIHIAGKTKRERSQNYKKAHEETRALASLQSPLIHTPKIYDDWYDEKNAVYYIVMDWIEGKTLREKFSLNSEEKGEVLYWIRELCLVLQAMGKEHMFHKDIKPDNIMIAKDGSVWLLDFNITIGPANLIEGTPNYKAPEMEHGSKSADRSKVDIFAIGVMLYEYFTGSVPINGIDYGLKNKTKSQSRVDKWDYFTEPKEKNPKMTDAENKLILRCMSYNPADRFKNYSDLNRALKSLNRNPKGESHVGKQKY